MKARLAFVLAVIASMALLGCGKTTGERLFDPALFVYPDQSTPEHTVLRMAAAVERRDSVMTDSVYANDYVGTSTDTIDPNAITLTFTKSDEVRVVGAMALSTDLRYVRFELYPPTWAKLHYAPDPPDWVTIQIPYLSIEIGGFTDGFAVQSPSQGTAYVFEYTLRPVTPSPTSPTDTTWQIVRWVESRSET